MSNRYVDFALAANVSKRLKKHLAQPTNEKEQRRKNRVEDITEVPRKIWGNEAHRRKVRQAQDAMNYRNEADRLLSQYHANRIPANRTRLYEARYNMLRNKYRQAVPPPMVHEGGVYHHV